MLTKVNINWNSLTDHAIVEQLGNFIRQHRLDQNKSQAQLAVEAGVSRVTLVQLEQGKHVNIITFVALLRALGLLPLLDSFVVQPQLSPLQLAELDEKKRQRASKAKKKSKRTKSDW